MNQKIYSYLDQYKIPRGLEGYELLERVILLTLNNSGASLQTNMGCVAAEKGISVSQLRGRIRYVLMQSDSLSADCSAVNRFVRHAVHDLRYSMEDSDAS